MELIINWNTESKSSANISKQLVIFIRKIWSIFEVSFCNQNGGSIVPICATVEL